MSNDEQGLDPIYSEFYEYELFNSYQWITQILRHPDGQERAALILEYFRGCLSPEEFIEDDVARVEYLERELALVRANFLMAYLAKIRN
jgi:hypothetical protein